MEYGFIKTCTIRAGIVLGWLLVLGIFLYAPTMLWRQDTKSITIFTWPMLLDVDYIKRFEKETGIKVNVTYYENSQSLISRLQSSQGRGYDLILAADNAIDTLATEGYLQKIDTSKLSFYNDLDPHLLNHYYDPNNEYSIPYFWAIYVLGINSDYYTAHKPQASWQTLFEKQPGSPSICMTDDAQEATMIAAKYLFGSGTAVQDPATWQPIEQLLKQQKKLVEVYSQSRAEGLLATNICPIVLALSSDVWRLQQAGNHVQSLIPREGTFLIIDGLVIPRYTKKQDQVYEFINFLFSKESLEHHSHEFGFCPARRSIVIPDQEELSKQLDNSSIEFFKNIVPDKLLNDAWIRVMAE